MKITISNININNHSSLKYCLGIAGYVGAERLINETSVEVDLGSDEFREYLDIKDEHLEKMYSKLLLSGFKLNIDNP